MMVCLLQLSCNRGGLPMFELVDSQPSHMVSVDALNLTPGEWTAYSLQNIFQKIQFMKMNCNVFFFSFSRVDAHFTDFSDSDRLERFFDSEDEEFEILSLWGTKTMLYCSRQLGERFSVSSLYQKGSLRGWTLIGDLLSQSSSNGVVSVCHTAFFSTATECSLYPTLRLPGGSRSRSSG